MAHACCGNTRRLHNSARKCRKDYKVPRPQDRSEAALGKESNSIVPVVIGATGAIPKELEKHLKTQGLDHTKPTPKSSTARHNTYHAKIPLRFSGPWRGFELWRFQNSSVQVIW